MRDTVMRAKRSNLMEEDDAFVVTCPYCGEAVEIYLEPDLKGSVVQDCEVCCNPWRVRISRVGGRRCVDVARADGSE